MGEARACVLLRTKQSSVSYRSGFRHVRNRYWNSDDIQNVVKRIKNHQKGNKNETKEQEKTNRRVLERRE